MMEYLLKSMLCLVILLLIHRLFLQREVMHQFNRFFLLGAVVFSFIIPFNSIEVATEKEEITYPEITETDFSEEFVLPEQSFPQENFTVETAQTPDKPFPWNEVLWSIYGLITLVLLVRFIRNIKVLMDQVQQNLKVTYKGMTLVLLPKASLPYTFLKYVFVPRTDFENGELADAIIEHEYTHVKEGHSYDILFLEALLIPFWFHPGLYLAKQAIRLNHEFIADQKALKTTSLYTYQKMLLALASQEVRFSLVSNLNFSLTKKRLKMMKQQSNPFQKWIKMLVLIPVLGALVYVFSEKVEAYQEPEVEGQEEVLLSGEIEKDFTLNSDGTFFHQGKNYQISQLPDILENLDGEHTIINIFANSEVKMGVIQDFQRTLMGSGVNKVKYQSSTGQVQLAATKVFNQDPIESKEQSTVGNEIKIIVLNSNKFIYNGATEDFGDLAELLKALKSDELLINLYASSNTELGVIQDYQTEFREAGINKIKYSSLDEGVRVGSNKPSFGKDKHYRNATFFVENEKSELLKKSYDMLSDEEKKMLVFVPSTPKKSSPTLEEFESFKDPEKFAVWLDGKHIQNTELEKIKHSDIAHVFNSFVHTNARSERFPQEHQVHLYTEEGFENTYGPSSGFTTPLTKEDKLYLYPSENRVNRGMPWVKKDNGAVTEQKSEVSRWPPGVQAETLRKEFQTYVDTHKEYEALRNQAPHFVKRSKAEQDNLIEMYSELERLYLQIPFHDKPKVKYPVLPFTPYIMLESDGKVYYKKGKDLTAEELEKYPPPPPPLTPAEQVENYKKVFYQYELMSNKGRNDASLSMDERNTLFLMYNELQVKYLRMGAPERRQVKMVNFPYYRVEENGKMILKAISELTPEQRALNNC